MIQYDYAGQTIIGEGHKEMRLAAEKAALLFADNGWEWATNDGPAVPDADRIVYQMISLLCDTANRAVRADDGYARTSSGRLYAEVRRYPDGPMSVGFGIEFQL